MKTNPVKQKLRRGELTFGSFLAFDSLHSVRVMARSGFDWLTLDMEHYPIDWSQAAAIFASVAEVDCVPLCRVPEGDHYCIKRALDAGAWGIVVPMVNTPQQAQAAIAAAKYPPLGNRSAGGNLHTLNFAAAPGEYLERANDEILVVLQSESPTGVENAEAIYSLPGCDAILVGPCDLSFNMRTLDGGNPNDAEHEALVQRVIETGKRLGVPTGIHLGTLDDARRRVEQGMQFISFSSDLSILVSKLKEVVESLQGIRRLPEEPERF